MALEENRFFTCYIKKIIIIIIIIIIVRAVIIKFMISEQKQ